MLSHGQIVRDKSGRATHLLGISFDVTDRHTAEQTLRDRERLLGIVTSTARVGLVVVNESYEYLFANEAYAEIFGLDAHQIVGRRVPDLLATGWPQIQPRLDRALAGEQVVYELALPSPSAEATSRWFRVLYEPGSNAIEKPTVVVVVVDVTEQKRTEFIIRDSEQRYRLLFEANPHPMWVYDLKTLQFLAVNDTAVRCYGYSREEFLAMTIKDIRPEEDLPQLEAAIRRLTPTPSLSSQWRHRKKDGTLIDVEVNSNDFRDGERDARLVLALDVTERLRAEETLRLRDRAIQAVSQGILITDPNQKDNPIFYASAGFERLTGYKSDELIGKNCRILQGQATDKETVSKLRKAILVGDQCTVEILNYRKDGVAFWNELSISPVRDEVGRLTHFVGIQVDITARRTLEGQFHQAQKMEAFGQLAGGVAHDFNNLITIINGYSELLIEDLSQDDPQRAMLEEIRKAGDRSASLTRQLLAFSRQQVLLLKVLDLNEVVHETEKMLRRLIGEDIELHTVLNPRLDRVKADPGQLEQVLMNLLVNARDAMPQGGKLTIETKNIELDEEYSKVHPEVRPGHFVMLAVTDSGQGMTEEVCRRLFEPFFTTKEIGKGTGLGMAVVHGIVKQSEGSIEVYSEPGVGTCFKIYLPRAEPSPIASKSSEIMVIPSRGTETILIVEDEDALRGLTVHAIRRSGYVVLEASNGGEALRLAVKFLEPIHLLVTDVVMPGMGGRQLAEHLQASHPKMKVLYLSGYTDDAVIRHGILQEQVNFLQKPFSPSSLAHKVREVLSQS